MRFVALGLLALSVLTACDLARGDVILVNADPEPRLYGVVFGVSGASGVPDMDNLKRIGPSERIVIGSALALADSGGVSVTVFSLPSDSTSMPKVVRTDAVGANYLRDVFGDIVLGED